MKGLRHLNNVATSSLVGFPQSQPNLKETHAAINLAIDGSEACLRALAFGCKHLVNPKRDRVTLLSVGELDLDVSDVMMEAFDSAISLIGVDADNSMKHAKTRYALQIAKQTLLKAEEALHGHFLDESTRGADHVFYRLCGLASATPQDAIAGFMNAVSMEHDCENAVLVVGSRGMGTVSRLLVGSTTDYLLHNCVGGCTLVIVK
ncbi:hypothetical protein BC830DRAFT_700788 [Chytriomyces sp. MP71]|nr:hypothetical protein BC830DRAFT_700788 [Chytriomyces sp. MP71]